MLEPIGVKAAWMGPWATGVLTGKPIDSPGVAEVNGGEAGNGGL